MEEIPEFGMSYDDAERRRRLQRLSRRVAETGARIARAEAESELDRLQIRDALKRLNASDQATLELSEEVARVIASSAERRSD